MLRVGEEGIENKAIDSEWKETFLRALWINKVWTEDFWFRLELVVCLEKWLFSHAGIHPDFWPNAGTSEGALEDLLMEREGVIGDLFGNQDHPLLEAGPARGGQQRTGGPLWLDWEQEFVDALPFAQIVGHSAGTQPRRKGRSWCIDCAQRGYGIVEDDRMSFVSTQ